MKDLDFIYLKNEQGKEEKMKVITFFKVEDTGNEYVVVTPYGIDTDEAYVLKYSEDEDGNELYSVIEDDDEFKIVSETYDLLMSEEIIE